MSTTVVTRLDKEVQDFVLRTRFFHEPMTPGRARNFVQQHRLNTRQRNSVLKLKVATNCPIWEIRLQIIDACSQEVIGDHEYGGGRAHWEILEGLGQYIGMDLESDIRNVAPLPSTQMCWNAWNGLMASTHWLEGLIANTCAERSNVPGYGDGTMRARGWFGLERKRWGELFGLSDEQLEFFEIHGPADIEHSNLGWQTVAEYAQKLSMEDQVVRACRENLVVWESYLNGIASAGDVEDRALSN
ncbi:MAG: hypothetical protein CFH10_01912 [Alphaproteobacteria bacterium MarineAlpha4_Bin2]|nr:MAG: hypothetical protein CFH10_01912 [Alphaproteobacteria bacterium MarineAlpha4_Bin2]